MRTARLIPPTGPHYAVGDVRAVVPDPVAAVRLGDPVAAA